MKLTISKKLYAGFGVVLALTASVALLGWVQLGNAAAEARTMYQSGALGIRYALETNTWMIASAREEKRAILAPAGADRAKLIDQARDEMNRARQSMKDYQGR